MPLQQAYGMSTYSIAPNINIYDNNLRYAFSSPYTLRVYNLDKITTPIDISGICHRCTNLNHNLKLPPHIINADVAFFECGNLSMPVVLKNQNIDNAYGMFMGCYNLNNNIIIQDCILNNAEFMFEYAAANSNEIIINNVIINSAKYFMSYIYNSKGYTSKHFEINVRVNDAYGMFAYWNAINNNGPIYIDNSNFFIISANNDVFSSWDQLCGLFGSCYSWYLRNTNLYIGNGDYHSHGGSYLCQFGWADNCNFTIGDGHHIQYLFNFGNTFTTNRGTVQNCNFNFGNNWNYYGYSFDGAQLIDNCNFNFGDNYNNIEKVFYPSAGQDNRLIIRNTNVNFGNNYNNFKERIIHYTNYVIDCNFNLGNNYNNIEYCFRGDSYINCNFILGDNIKNIRYLFGASSNLIGDFYFKIGNNIEEISYLSELWQINHITLNSLSVILGNNINNLYLPIQLDVNYGKINKANIIVGNNINKIAFLISTPSIYDYSCSNFNISIGHNIDNIYGAIRYLGNNSKVFIGNNINYLGDFLSLGINAYHNQNYSLNNINTIDYTFLTLNNNSLYKGELRFSNVNYINGLIRGRSSSNNEYLDSNIYLNDVNTINQLIYYVNWINGTLYLNNVNHINGLIFYCNSFNKNIDFPSTLQSFNRICVSCDSFNQNFQIPRNVLYMDGTFYNCHNFNQNILIPENVQSLNRTFYDCINYNYPIIIPNNVKTTAYMLAECTKYNSPVTFADNSKVEYLTGMFDNCITFNQNLNIPSSAIDLSLMLNNCCNYNCDIRIYSTKVNNVWSMLNYDYYYVSRRVNIYVKNKSTTNSTIYKSNSSQSNSIINSSFRWSTNPSNECYYNSYYNIYVYYNL